MADLRHSRFNFRIFIALISVVIFIESTIPYMYAEKKTPPGGVFLGQIAYMADQNMYFSFISQAKEGHFLLNNKLTAIHNKPVFVNLEFWLVGFIQHITGISENAVYHVWRYLGILLLTFGIVFLAKTVLPTARQVVITTIVLLFTGGFGFIIALLNGLHLIDAEATQAGIIDMRYGILPFQQMTTNPHFSFPHGLILIAYALFLRGEKDGRLKYYALSGLVFNIIALVRPYDILPPIVVFPLYIIITNNKIGIDLRKVFIRLLPLFMIIPVFLYNVWLFKVNDAFKYWSSQGHNAGAMPSVFWHYFAFGVVGVLAYLRMLRVRIQPLSNFEKFLAIWFGVTFTLIHLGKYFPVLGWSPQIGVYLAVPLGLLAFSNNFQFRRKPVLYAGIVAIVLAVIAGNVSTVLYFTKNFKNHSKDFLYYAGKDEAAAWQWMNKNIKPGNVVLALPTTASQLAKYTPASVVAAHYSVTPRYAENEAIVNKFFSGTIDTRKKPVIDQLNADYLYMGPYEASMAHFASGQEDNLQEVYKNPAVTIYKVKR